MEPVRKIKSVDKKKKIRWDETQKTLISMFHKYFSWIYSNRQRFNQEKVIKPKEGMQRRSRTGEISPVVKDVLLASISAHYGAETESHKSKEIILLGECGWANWPRLVYVSPCWAKRKSRARWWRWAGPGRTHCGHPLPLTHTLHWIICLSNTTGSAGSGVNSSGAPSQLAFPASVGLYNWKAYRISTESEPIKYL